MPRGFLPAAVTEDEEVNDVQVNQAQAPETPEEGSGADLPFVEENTNGESQYLTVLEQPISQVEHPPLRQLQLLIVMSSGLFLVHCPLSTV